jgi:hypothetical protein
MNTAVPITSQQIAKLLLVPDDSSPLCGLRIAQQCLDHLIEYFQLPEPVLLELRACRSCMDQAELHVRMAASRAAR